MIGNRTHRIKLILTLVMFMTTLLLAAPRPAHACSCAAPAAPAQALGRADAVFAGKVTAIETPLLNRITGSGDIHQVTFAVSEVWKGEVPQEITLSTAASSAACGYEFASGSEYLVYAGETRDGLSTGLCSRTQPLSAATEDLDALGAGAAPAPGQGEGDLPSFLLPAGLLASFALLIFTVLYFVRHQVQVEG